MGECYVGRQAILNRSNEVYAYELLYRGSLDNTIGEIDRDIATSEVIMNTFIEIGLEKIVGHRLAFINMTEQFLETPELACFPAAQVVLDIPEDISPTPQVCAALERLKGEGYKVALDGYRSNTPLAQLLPYADAVKLDALEMDDDTLCAELEALEQRELMLMSKRVETLERRDTMAGLGFDYFQGHFLCKPQIVTGERLPTNKMAILQLMTKVSDPDIDNEELEVLIAQDASLSLRVLRFVNSPLSGLSREVDSIHQAVVLVGRNLIKNWVMLLAIANLDDNIPELMTMAFVRAKLCESLAAEARLGGKESFFTVGLFSLVDAIMGKPIEELLDSLPFSDEIKEALTQHGGAKGKALRCAEELELGAPAGVEFENLAQRRISELYLDSLNWADEMVVGAG